MSACTLLRLAASLVVNVALGCLQRPEAWDYVSTTDPGPPPVGR